MDVAAATDAELEVGIDVEREETMDVEMAEAVDVDMNEAIALELEEAMALELAAAWTVEAAAAALPALPFPEIWKMLLISWPMEIKWTMAKRSPQGEERMTW